MFYRIYYQQTADERYDTKMNATARQILMDAGLAILSESGGTAFMPEPGTPESEQEFIVYGTRDKVEACVIVIQHVVDHPVDLTKVAEVD